jgi:ABC-type transport system involved in multi-copper enzyme maturation permease subunit
MKERVQRIGAIIKAEFFLKFRRASTLVTFLLLCLLAYLVIPDPRKGYALLVVDGRRALYTSATVALATAVLSTLVLLLAGFYLASNSIRRDVETRTGQIIASTAVRSWEYLVGKFLGHLVFLSAIAVGFMASIMGMFLVRGEARLEPLVFVGYYLVIAAPAVVFAAMMALVFEAVPFLSGKLGDVGYFILWIAMVSLTTVGVMGTHGAKHHWSSYLDSPALAFVVQGTREAVNSDHFSIGEEQFDPAKPPIAFKGLIFDRERLLPRLGALLFPLPFFLVALVFFHRFDPARARSSIQRGQRNWLAHINVWIKEKSAALPQLLPSFSLDKKTSLSRCVLAEIRLTLQLSPLVLVLIIVCAMVSLTSSQSSLQKGILPVWFFMLVIVLADIATRERRAGTLPVVFAVPLVKSGFVWWKFLTALFFTLSLTLIPCIRLLPGQPGAAVSLMVGSLLVSALATSLGVLTGNPKSFIVTFLMFLYLVINDAGRSAGFDFAGWYGIATPVVQGSYLLVTAVLLVAAQLVYTYWQLRRDY